MVSAVSTCDDEADQSSYPMGTFLFQPTDDSWSGHI